MSRADLKTELCYGFYIDTIDVRTILFATTSSLVPGYILLSLVAVLSRRNITLKELASHGKTSATKDTTGGGESSSPSWCWISKRCFAHFYFIGLLSTFLTAMYQLKCYREKKQYHHFDRGLLGEIFLIRTAAVVLLIIHIARRAYECLYIQQYRDESSKMHIAGYALGMGHYAVLPLVFWDIDATNSSVVGDSNNDIKDENHSLGFGSTFSSLGITTTAIILGISTLNIWLQYEQHMHHVILADIRRVSFIEKKVDDKIKDRHKINLHQNRNYSLPPCRRWFRYVLCPHYLAEILLYLSFAVILEVSPRAVQKNALCGNISSNNFEGFFILGRMIGSLFVVKRYRHWMLFVWVVTNLTISAMNNFDWYNSRMHNETTDKKSDNSATGSASHRRVENAEKRRAIFPKIL